MGLAQIRRVRELGGKPAMVKVIVGDKPAWLPDDATLVHVPERAGLNALDWIPLVGLWCTVHWTSGPAERALAVLDCMERTGARLFGAASVHGVVALTANPTPRDEALIRKEWRMFCTA